MKRQGVNLLEMALVLAIVAVLVTLTVPAYNSFQQRQQLKRAAESLQRDAAAARELAIARQREVWLRLQGQGKDWCWGVSLGQECDCRQPGNCRIAQMEAGEFRQLQLSGPQSLRFSAGLGRLDTAARVEWRSTGGRKAVLALDRNGRGQVCEGENC